MRLSLADTPAGATRTLNTRKLNSIKEIHDQPFLAHCTGTEHIAKNRLPPARPFSTKARPCPFISRYRKEATGSLDEVAGHCHSRPAGAAARAGQTERGGPEIARRDGQADGRAEGKGAGSGDHDRARGHLSAVSPEAPDPGDDRKGEGTGAAGRQAVRPGAGHRSCCGSGSVSWTRKKASRRSRMRWPAPGTSLPSG